MSVEPAPELQSKRCALCYKVLQLIHNPKYNRYASLMDYHPPIVLPAHKFCIAPDTQFYLDLDHPVDMRHAVGGLSYVYKGADPCVQPLADLKRTTKNEG